MKEVEDILEVLSSRGCDAINQTLARWEQGQAPEEVKDLPDKQKDLIHKELKAMMRIYNERK